MLEKSKRSVRAISFSHEEFFEKSSSTSPDFTDDKLKFKLSFPFIKIYISKHQEILRIIAGAVSIHLFKEDTTNIFSKRIIFTTAETIAGESVGRTVSEIVSL
jgi:hypothetical protein